MMNAVRALVQSLLSWLVQSSNQGTLLAGAECFKHWTHLMTSGGGSVMFYADIARNLVQLMLPVLLVPEIQEMAQGTGLVNSLTVGMKYSPRCPGQHETLLQALINLTARNQPLQQELESSSYWLDVVAYTEPDFHDPPPPEAVQRLAYKLVKPSIQMQVYTQKHTNPVFGAADVHAVKAWGRTLKEFVVRHPASRSSDYTSERGNVVASNTMMDDVFRAAGTLMVARRGIVNLIQQRVQQFSNEVSNPDFTVEITTNQPSDMTRLAMHTLLAGGKFGALSANFMSKQHLQQGYEWSEADDGQEWLAMLYAEWVMGPIYGQMVQASKQEGKQNPTLQPWEQQLAKALIFNDNGVLLRFTSVPEVSSGDVTAWVKQLLQLDISKAVGADKSEDSDESAALQGSHALSLNHDRRLMRLFVFVELAYVSYLLSKAAQNARAGQPHNTVSEQGGDSIARAAANVTAVTGMAMPRGCETADSSNTPNSTHNDASAAAQSLGHAGPPLLEVCAACGATAGLGKKLKSCAGCLVTMYCSRACQNQHWKEHKLLCKLLQGKKTLKTCTTESAEQFEGGCSSSLG